jgi:hypothetical protein
MKGKQFDTFEGIISNMMPCLQVIANAFHKYLQWCQQHWNRCVYVCTCACVCVCVHVHTYACVPEGSIWRGLMTKYLLGHSLNFFVKHCMLRPVYGKLTRGE